MAKTTNLGLNLTEDENTSFSDWRKTIDGNGSGESKSNFQKIDEAIGAVISLTDEIWLNTPLSNITGKIDGGVSITDEQANSLLYNSGNTLLSINGVRLRLSHTSVDDLGDRECYYTNSYIVSESKIINCSAYIGERFGGSLQYTVEAITLSKNDDVELNSSAVADRNTTFNEWVAVSNFYHDIRIWYKYGEPNGDSIDLEPEVLITNLSVDIRDGVSGFSVFGLIAGAPLYGGKLRAVGVFLDPNAETVTHFDKEL
jgi:hypothetical protein